MWNTMMMIMLMTTTMMIMMNHPISMGMILLIQTINIAMITGKSSMNFWFSYIMFMIMIGGLMVLFMYMTGVASNEKFKMKKSVIMIMTMTIMVMITITKNKSDQMNYMNSLNILTSEQHMMSTSKFFNYPSSMIMTMLIIYLLMTMIATVKMTKMNKGPLRQKN